MASLPVEHAWRAMVAGMQIHEHFLEVRPMVQERRGQALYDHYRAAVDPQVPPLDSLRARFPDAFLEHCYRQPNPAGSRRAWESLRFAHIAASIASTAILVVDESDCLADREGERIVDVARLPRAARRPDPEVQRDVTALIEAADLTYLVQLNVKVLIQRSRRRPTTAKPAPGQQRFLYGTCELYPGEAPLACAENLLAEAAAQWMYCFLLARPAPEAVSEGTWLSPWTEQRVDSTTMAMEVLAHCIRLEFLEQSLAQGTVATGGACWRAHAERVEREQACLKVVEEFVRDIDASFSHPGGPDPPYNNLSVRNLLNSHYPWPERYGKYREGTGIGQYERS
jgi:hypothetical protein